jgi:hypothetical protein
MGSILGLLEKTKVTSILVGSSRTHQCIGLRIPRSLTYDIASFQYPLTLIDESPLPTNSLFYNIYVFWGIDNSKFCCRNKWNLPLYQYSLTAAALSINLLQQPLWLGKVAIN